MSKMVQVRNVPDELHHRLRVRAHDAGKTLTNYLLDELNAYALQPTVDEWLDAAERWEPIDVSEPRTLPRARS